MSPTSESLPALAPAWRTRAAELEAIERETARGEIGTARWLLTRILFSGIMGVGHGQAIKQLEQCVDAALKGFPRAPRWADREGMR